MNPSSLSAVCRIVRTPSPESVRMIRDEDDSEIREAMKNNASNARTGERDMEGCLIHLAFVQLFLGFKKNNKFILVNKNNIDLKR